VRPWRRRWIDAAAIPQRRGLAIRDFRSGAATSGYLRRAETSDHGRRDFRLPAPRRDLEAVDDLAVLVRDGDVQLLP
jgi:hypothetical protein